MARGLAELTSEAVALPTEERVTLLEALSRTLQPPPDDPIAAAWLDEAERRWAEMETGEAPGIPGEEVFADLRARFQR